LAKHTLLYFVRKTFFKESSTPKSGLNPKQDNDTFVLHYSLRGNAQPVIHVQIVVAHVEWWFIVEWNFGRVSKKCLKTPKE